MRIHLRLDKVQPEHITQTLFINGGNCGELIMRHDEYGAFRTMLILGADKMRKRCTLNIDKINHVKGGNFAMPKK